MLWWRNYNNNIKERWYVCVGSIPTALDYGGNDGNNGEKKTDKKYW